MSERKPIGLGWESWVDRLVREADERGEFENLRGKGEPIPGSGEAYDENWWLRGFLDREGANLLPDALALELEVEKSLATIATLRSEVQVRHDLDRLNARIREALPKVTSGPSTVTTEIDADEFVARWRQAASSPDH